MTVYLFFAFLSGFLNYGGAMASKLAKLSPFTDEEATKLYQSLSVQVIGTFSSSFGGGNGLKSNARFIRGLDPVISVKKKRSTQSLSP